MAKTFELADWMFEAVDLMVRTGCGLENAATQLGQKLSTEEANKVLRRAAFQDLLWEGRHRYFSKLGSDPHFKKDTAIGKLLDLSRKLEEEGEYDKAAEVLFKIGKMANWIGPESTVNVFGELSQKDLDAIREQVSGQKTTKRVN